MLCKPAGNNCQEKQILDSQKTNEITVKRKTQMPDTQELISRISRKIAEGPADNIWIPKFELDGETKKFVEWMYKEDFDLGL